MNYTVSAYDELKMCKSRTQAVDPFELQDESVMESNLIISKYEVGIQNERGAFICICIPMVFGVDILTCDFHIAFITCIEKYM